MVGIGTHWGYYGMLDHTKATLNTYKRTWGPMGVCSSVTPWVGAGQHRWMRLQPRPLRTHFPHPPCATRLSCPQQTQRSGGLLATLCCSTAHCCSCEALLHLHYAHWFVGRTGLCRGHCCAFQKVQSNIPVMIVSKCA